MRIYADEPVHRIRQIVADLLGLGWCILAVLAGKAVYDLIDTLAGPGRLLEDAGDGLADNLSGAGDNLSDLPLIGDAVSTPFEGAAGAAANVAGAGRTVQDFVGTMAALAGVSTAGFLILLAVLFWILPRLFWVRRAEAARMVLSDPDGVELLALRALATRRLSRLARIGDGLLPAWRRGDPEVVHALAELEMGRLGIRMPPRLAAPRTPPAITAE
ncbi:MAG TPA: hypothetical protein VJ644_05650 [Jiangellaceae bacterium]|nr:hypothetical protein [Jiangellaceae bacterium]